MTGGFTKLFSSIITSSIWREDSDTCKVWITLLALSDRHGDVAACLPAIATLSAVSDNAAKVAIGRLMSPDPHSRTKDHEGRRLREIEGGWHIINYRKYREKDTTGAERARRFRERHGVTARNGKVTESNAKVTYSRSIEHRAEAEADKEKKGRASLSQVLDYAKTIDVAPSDAEGFYDSQEAGGWKRGGKPLADWKAALRNWKRNGWLASQKLGVTKPVDDWRRYDKQGRRVDASGRLMDSNQIREAELLHKWEEERKAAKGKP